MMRRLPFFLLVVGACGGSGGDSAAPQMQGARLVVQPLDEGIAGGALPILVSVRRGNTLVADYTGMVTFQADDPAAYYPGPYRFTNLDGGEKIFTSGFVFPAGVHVLTVTGEGIDAPAQVGVSVRPAPGSSGTYVPPVVPAPPSHEFMTRMEPPFAKSSALDLALSDFDGDGDVDLVAPRPGSTGIWLNDGTGALTLSSQTLPAGMRVASADVDGDGDEDLALIVGDLTSYKAQIWLNAGKGAFAAGADVAVKGWDPVFADVDGDGDPDLLLVEGQTLVVRANDGKGDFGTVIQQKNEIYVSQYATGGAHRSILSDLDGDGDLDLLASRTVYRNDGSGVFATTGQAFDRDVRGATFGDMDGDGDLDLVLGNYMQENDIYLNDGTGSFQRLESFDTGVFCTTDMPLLDIDEDGDLDIIEINFSVPDVIWLNEGGGTFTGMWIIFPGGEFRMVMGDLTGDGLLDIVASEYWESRMVWYRND